jgi:hypothetical protein
MQRPITFRIWLCACVFALTLSMCTKQGPPGATGPAGATGATGPQGPSGYSAYWYIPALTQGIYDSGAILLYAQSQFGFIYQLPFYMELDNTVSYISDAIQPGGVVLSCNGNLDTYTFR